MTRWQGEGVVMVSLWKEDVGRRLEARARALLGKSYAGLRWVWVVGDSEDGTEERLRVLARERPGRVTVVRQDTGMVGEEPEVRLRRLSVTVNAAWEFCAGARWVVLHESDIDSPVDVVERFVAHARAGRCPVAGWPVLGYEAGAVFYDIWAYRAGGGVLFSNWPPYHDVYRADEVFEVESVGTCWMFEAVDVVEGGVRCVDRAVLDLCAGMRRRGRRFWVDPGIRVVQPMDLWVSRRVVV